MTKKLYRSKARKMIAGVCGGLADYFDIDTSVVRLIFVAISLVTAVIPMVIFYIIAWIIIPVEEPAKDRVRPARGEARGARRTPSLITP